MSKYFSSTGEIVQGVYTNLYCIIFIDVTIPTMAFFDIFQLNFNFALLKDGDI